MWARVLSALAERCVKVCILPGLGVLTNKVDESARHAKFVFDFAGMRLRCKTTLLGCISQRAMRGCEPKPGYFPTVLTFCDWTDLIRFGPRSLTSIELSLSVSSLGKYEVGNLALQRVEFLDLDQVPVTVGLHVDSVGSETSDRKIANILRSLDRTDSLLCWRLEGKSSRRKDEETPVDADERCRRPFRK